MMLARSPRLLFVSVLLAALAACTPKDSTKGTAPPDVAGPPADAIVTPSGLASKVLRVGLGRIKPGPRSTVRVHYTGWTTDGKKFDSSYHDRTARAIHAGTG